jgi:arylsulfatase A-like enzyme
MSKSLSNFKVIGTSPLLSGLCPLFALIFALASGCAPESEKPRPNILLISIDTLRADHLSFYGYTRQTTPNLDRYFAGAEIFENAFTPATYTSASVISMLSGLYPRAHGVRDFYRTLSDDIKILPDFLREAGYQSAAIVSNSVLSNESLGIANRFDHYDDFVNERESKRLVFQRRARLTTDAALHWLVVERDDAEPHFLWVHYVDPHAPYSVPHDFDPPKYNHEGSIPLPADFARGSYSRRPGIKDALDYVDFYDQEIAYADHEIGRLLDVYSKQGFLEDAIVILTSDHGESIFEHKPYMEHSRNLYANVLRIPLLVRWPMRAGQRNPVPVSLVDLLPTILSEIKQEIPADLQGQPWRERRETDVLLHEVFSGTRYTGNFAVLYSATVNQRKWNFRVSEEGQVEGLESFDLNEDALEQNPLPWLEGDADTRDVLTRTIESLLLDPDLDTTSERGRSLRRPKVAPALEADQREALRALGYLE